MTVMEVVVSVAKGEYGFILKDNHSFIFCIKDNSWERCVLLVGALYN